MKIVIEIPDWPEDEYKDIFVMFGQEQRAFYRHFEKVWHVKTTKCSQCGKCCMNLSAPYPLKENGDCLFLGDDGPDQHPCTNPLRPFACIEGDRVMNRCGKNLCSIRYDGEE